MYACRRTILPSICSAYRCELNLDPWNVGEPRHKLHALSLTENCSCLVHDASLRRFLIRGKLIHPILLEVYNIAPAPRNIRAFKVFFICTHQHSEIRHPKLRKDPLPPFQHVVPAHLCRRDSGRFRHSADSEHPYQSRIYHLSPPGQLYLRLRGLGQPRV
jgi:hypothetical protein